MRTVVLLVLGWSFMAITTTTFSLVSLLTFRVGVTAYSHYVARFIARGILRLSGVRIELSNGELLRGHRTRIIAINHTSQLDMFIVSSLMPKGGTALAKREIMFIPFLGWIFFAMRVVFVNRGNHQAAMRSVKRAADQIRDRKATVWFSPEGTRAIDGTLGPFKMGLFHLAEATKAPILPMIIRGASECQPMGQLVARPGVVSVELLDEIDTADFTPENLKEKRDALHQLFERQLGGARG